MENNMRVLSVSWSPESDVTKLKFTDEFLSSDWIVRADVLKDLVGDITRMYQQTVMEELSKKRKKSSKKPAAEGQS
jgi:hypothetical protein